MKCMHKRFYTNLLMALTLTAGTLLSPAAQAGVNTAAIPGALTQALSIYKKDGPRAFIHALVSGGPLEGNKEMRMEILVLEKIEKYYGAYQSYDILQINRLSDSTRLVYFLLNYQKGPVFGTLTAFNNGGRDTITSFQFHTKAEKIFPQALLVSH